MFYLNPGVFIFMYYKIYMYYKCFNLNSFHFKCQMTLIFNKMCTFLLYEAWK